MWIRAVVVIFIAIRICVGKEVTTLFRLNLGGDELTTPFSTLLEIRLPACRTREEEGSSLDSCLSFLGGGEAGKG